MWSNRDAKERSTIGPKRSNMNAVVTKANGLTLRKKNIKKMNL